MSEVAWTRAEFEDRLRAKERFYHIHHPFHVLMNAGKLEREAIQGWVANRFYYQVEHPRQGRRGARQLPGPRGAPGVDQTHHRP